MPRYFMHLAYRGEAYHGWQSQPNAVSVQQVLEEALSTIVRSDIRITGAGRTDAGVNARMMIAHFDMPYAIESSSGFIRALNSLVGRDIAVYSVKEVHDDAHARFDAISRTYHYYAYTGKSPFFYPLAWKAPENLDYESMNRAARHLLDTDDFTSFAKLHTDTKTNICHVTEAEWRRVADEGWVFVITADRFLRNMVRAVVGTLVDVGRGKINEQQFVEIIKKRNRCAAGTSMPPQALYLWNITYPYYRI